MSQPLHISALDPLAFGPAERAAWDRIRSALPHYASPYFDLRYVLAAAAVAPDAVIGVLRRNDEIIGFLPVQRRGRTLLPLGAPMTDYHGPLLAPGEVVDTRQVIEALGAKNYRFSGLVGEAAPGFRALQTHRTMVADLSCGFETWLAFRQEQYPRYFKDRRRTQRSLEREVGPVTFNWSRSTPEIIDYVVALKRTQLYRTRQHDIFACGWTLDLLRSLAEMDSPDFGLGYATVSAGGVVISAEIGLLSGGVYHLWQPAYDPAYSKYGPGHLVTLLTLEVLAAQGINYVDFGRDDAPYKAFLADPAQTVLEGVADAGEARIAQLADRALAAGPLHSLSQRVHRRFNVITACETSRLGWSLGVAMACGLMLQGAPIHRSPHPSMPRRPDAHRTHSGLDARSEAGVSSKALNFLPPAA